jgi:hypothetical protein
MQALYVEEKQGMELYHEYLNDRRNFRNRHAIAPRESKTENEIMQAPIYDKGAWVLHTLRYLIGEDALRTVLRRMAYPYPWMEKITDGRQVRFASTDDFVRIAREVSGRDLDWFFEVYLRQRELPELSVDIHGQKLTLAWEAPEGMEFPMPIEIGLGQMRQRVEVPADGVVLDLEPGITPSIDPDRWVLLDPAGKAAAEKYTKEGNYREARALFDKVLLITPEDSVVMNIMRHLDYAEKNPEKLQSDFFNPYLGKYQSERGTTITIVEKDNHLRLEMGIHTGFTMYPVSDTEFTILEAKRIYRFVREDDGTVTEFVGGRGSYKKIQ